MAKGIRLVEGDEVDEISAASMLMKEQLVVRKVKSCSTKRHERQLHLTTMRTPQLARVLHRPRQASTRLRVAERDPWWPSAKEVEGALRLWSSAAPNVEDGVEEMGEDDSEGASGAGSI